MARAVRMTRAAISPRLATSRRVMGMLSRSHSEDAETTASGDGPGMGGGQGHAEHRAGVTGIYDPVVVQLGRDEEGVGLPFDLGFDGLSARRVRSFVEGQSPALGGLPAHDGH